MTGSWPSGTVNMLTRAIDAIPYDNTSILQCSDEGQGGKIMGLYINKGNEAFQRIRNSEYVDKTELIRVVNSTLFTENCFSCVSRCRRFGKSMAAKMLAAYYDHSCDSRSLFADLKIAGDPSFEKHLNKYPVICLDVASFVAGFRDGDAVEEINAALLKDIRKAYPSIATEEKDSLMDCLMRIADETGDRFIFIIDEWEAICREYSDESSMMNRYVDWLRRMFKSLEAINVFAGVYMTGILPIKKYKTQSALNNFQEYSMVKPGGMAGFFGFTKAEVKALAAKDGMDYDELEKWYDGYQIGSEQSIFNPNSVMTAVREHWCESYWGRTGAADAISSYISLNYEGLKDDVILMLAGGRCKVDPTGFKNDLSEINSRDDVLTVLIHLGYLSYDRVRKECHVPNLEVAGELETAIRDNNWKPVVDSLKRSEQLLHDTLDGNCEAVAKAIEAVHDENTSILSYNNENSLACVISLAYYYARNDYVIHREYASGKGFADLVLIPRKHVDSPAIVVELKYGSPVDTAISQIQQKNYPAKVAEYADRLLLVGISYDPKSKRHSCVIKKNGSA